MKKVKNIIVLCVDRDDDIGTKTGIKGPIIGKENVINTAVKLSLADPEDSDSNALFGAVKAYEEVKKKYNAEIAVLTGDKNVGIESDRKISDQLNAVLKKHPSDYALFVTDGVGDEHLIPIIQSRLPILSVKRIVVNQAENLESTYYKIHDFIKDSLEDPRIAALVFGLPAIALLLYALLGSAGWRIILGAIGVFLLIKGFKMEQYFSNFSKDLIRSFTTKSTSLFLYIISIAIAGIAIVRSYKYVLAYADMGIFEMLAAFFSSSIFILWLSGTIFWIGICLSRKKLFSRAVSVSIFGIAVAFVIYAAVNVILIPETPFLDFVVYIIFSFILLLIALLIERIY